ncbi:class III lanthionine synthetase LanKC [Nocardia sp. NPDC127579]|uniref:class III lanthionine synthetase LanKC n=1 Tax=Nocardia sp. NPDC127579 TaxID=3345402 RepID=UPI00363A0493
MDIRYLDYCFADNWFYDTPRPDGQDEFPETTKPLPAGWVRRPINAWMHVMPPHPVLPGQGWKIHASATPGSVREVLSTSYAYCVDNALPFKFLPTPAAFTMANGKQASRSGSGKLVTIYPRDIQQLQQTLEELGGRLDGADGPYILSDLRWGAGPLHVRYGGFIERYCTDESGDQCLAIEDPTGRLVPDHRGPVFSVPEWLDLPGFLVPHIEALGGSEAPADFPYRIERSLHFSNGGGVYLAEDQRDNTMVVLKEARPHTAIDSLGRDSVARLRHEHSVLEQLDDIPGVVRAHGLFQVWEHSFLATEYVDAKNLNELIVEKLPLLSENPSTAEKADYREWALRIISQIEAVLNAMHERGITYGDLHPMNILVRDDGDIELIDLELAYSGKELCNIGAGAPGYTPPPEITGPAADRYSLACLKIAVFLPLTLLYQLDRHKADLHVDQIRDIFGLPSDYIAGIRADLRIGHTAPAVTPASTCLDSLTEAQPDFAGLQRSIADAILATATPKRADRLFPGDIEQFTANAAGFAHGAAGTLWSLSNTGFGRHPEYEAWLIRQVERGAITQVGFYDGLHGIAYTFDRLGRTADAAAIVDQAAYQLETLSSDLYHGLAGIGLTLLHLAGQDRSSTYFTRALEVADLLAARMDERADQPKSTRIGLLHGDSGPALFFLRLFESASDIRYLDRARRAIGIDLAGCVTVGSRELLLVDEGRRALPGVAAGSAGIGLVITEYLRHRHDPEFAAALAGIVRAAGSDFFIHSSLFSGRAGMIGLLAHVRDSAVLDIDAALIDAHLRKLAWHAIDYRGHVAFPGEQLLRLSMDVGTGNAGLLLAIRCALQDQDGSAELLPFL